MSRWAKVVAQVSQVAAQVAALNKFEKYSVFVLAGAATGAVAGGAKSLTQQRTATSFADIVEEETRMLVGGAASGAIVGMSYAAAAPVVIPVSVVRWANQA